MLGHVARNICGEMGQQSLHGQCSQWPTVTWCEQCFSESISRARTYLNCRRIFNISRKITSSVRGCSNHHCPRCSTASNRFRPAKSSALLACSLLNSVSVDRSWLLRSASSSCSRSNSSWRSSSLSGSKFGLIFCSSRLALRSALISTGPSAEVLSAPGSVSVNSSAFDVSTLVTISAAPSVWLTYIRYYIRRTCLIAKVSLAVHNTASSFSSPLMQILVLQLTRSIHIQ